MAPLTKTDQYPLQGLVGGRLQVEEGQFVVSAQLHLVSDGFKQCRGPVQLGGKTAMVTSSQTWHEAVAGRAASRADIPSGRGAQPLGTAASLAEGR